MMPRQRSTISSWSQLTRINRRTNQSSEHHLHAVHIPVITAVNITMGMECITQMRNLPLNVQQTVPTTHTQFQISRRSTRESQTSSWKAVRRQSMEGGNRAHLLRRDWLGRKSVRARVSFMDLENRQWDREQI